MKWSGLAVLSLIALAPAPALAQPADWLVRCSMKLADDAKPESAKYVFLTQGKTAGAVARGELDYKTSVSARAVTFPTDAKDFLNPYSNLSLGLGYVVPGDGRARPTVGTVSLSAIGKDFNPIPGPPITMKLVIDGVAFGPYTPKPVSSGMYSVWLDTADTDGDGKAPTLSPAEFEKLAKAIGAMKAVEMALVQNGADIARASIPFTQLPVWLDGFGAWAAKTSPGVGAATSCFGGGQVLN